VAFVTDFLDDGRVRAWTLDPGGGATATTREYAPRFYVAARGGRDADRGEFMDLRAHYEAHPDVLGTAFVHKRTFFGRDPERVLAVDSTHVDRVRALARQAHEVEPTGDFACYDVDQSPGFRYHLDALGESGGRVVGAGDAPTDPTPARDPVTLEISVPEAERGADAHEALDVDSVASSTRRGNGTASGGSVDGVRIEGTPSDVAGDVESRIADVDPDVLVLDTAQLVPRLANASARAPGEYALGREPGYRRLAGESTYTSYGQVGHSPARYAIPGRAIIDRANTFFHNETSMAGVLDLVARSHKPLQELAWASIGNVLTAIQIRKARDRDVLVPWHAWRAESFASLRTLHDADRGGLTLSPAVGRHHDVHELDFASLYPNVICTRNVSPDTIRCRCHRNREDVPGLGYAVCDDDGYLPEVLQPLVDDREAIKADLAAERASDDPDQERIAELEGRSSAIKWILVSCFGYQGFSNAKFGRIECHEAINAYAREILLAAKERLEAGGWRVLHGIVDSLWVTPPPTSPSASANRSTHSRARSPPTPASAWSTKPATTGWRSARSPTATAAHSRSTSGSAPTHPRASLRTSSVTRSNSVASPRAAATLPSSSRPSSASACASSTPPTTPTPSPSAPAKPPTASAGATSTPTASSRAAVPASQQTPTTATRTSPPHSNVPATPAAPPAPAATSSTSSSTRTATPVNASASPASQLSATTPTTTQPR